MGAKLQITSLTFGFLLYILDVGSDVYVAFRYYKNGQTTYFIAAVVLGAPPIIIVNIYATFCLRSQWKIVKCFLFITHLAMVKLFFDELFRCKEENEHSHNGKHFSKCDCYECKLRFKASIKYTLEYTMVRYMEAFAEAAPQWCFQVMVLRHNGGPYPWYAIASIALSFVSMLWSIYCLEKAYWINWRVEQNLKPATFPKSSAILFLVWQTLLLLSRCLTFVILPRFVTVFYIVIIHWSVIFSVMLYFFRGHPSARCIARGSSLITSFPWHFHVSTSGLEAPNKYFFGREDRMEMLRRFIRVALVLTPALFMAEFGIVIGFLTDLPYSMKMDLLVGGSAAILTANFASLLYYKCCYPAIRGAQVDVERGIINVQPINDDE